MLQPTRVQNCTVLRVFRENPNPNPIFQGTQNFGYFFFRSASGSISRYLNFSLSELPKRGGYIFAQISNIKDMYKIFFENMDRMISALIQYLGSVDDEEHQVARHAQPLPCRNAQHGAAAALARELRQVIHRRTECRSVPRRAEVHQRCAGPGSSAS